MSRPIRIQDAHRAYFVSNYTIQHTYLFIPRDTLNRLILGCLARAVCKHHVQVFAFIFYLNRFEMLLSASHINLPKFMECFEGEVAKAINRYHGRSGKFFARRYDQSEVLDQAAYLERLGHMMSGPRALGLAESLDQWQGVHSFRYAKKSAPVRGSWLNRTVLAWHKRKTQNKRTRYIVPPDAGVENYGFELADAPFFEGISAKKRQKMFKKAARDALKRRKKARAGLLPPVMSATTFARMHWRDYPRPAASPRRYERVYSGCLSLKRQRLRQIREITRKYAVAMQVYKANKQVPQFPRHTNRPGLVRSEQAPPPPDPVFWLAKDAA